uniref:Uncharacterized protein n=1 Tax=Salix viminalis TaxID=40686 RepID=A0A6N2LGT7_SALVM
MGDNEGAEKREEHEQKEKHEKDKDVKEREGEEKANEKKKKDKEGKKDKEDEGPAKLRQATEARRKMEALSKKREDILKLLQESRINVTQVK